MLAMFLIQFTGTFCYSVAGLGGGIIITIGWTVLGHVGVTDGSISGCVAHVFIHAGLTSPLMILRLRRHVRWCWALSITILYNISQLVGAEVLSYADGVWLKRSLGLCLLAVFFAQIVQQFGVSLMKRRETLREKACRDSNEADTIGSLAIESILAVTPSADSAKRRTPADMSSLEHPPKEVGAELSPANVDLQLSEQTFDLTTRFNVVASVCLGLGAGFLQGLFGIPFLAFLCFTLVTNIPKQLWRANVNVIVGCAVPINAYFYFVHQGNYKQSQLQVYVASALAVLVAVPAGDIAAARMDQRTFRDVTTLFMFFGALLLATAETGLVSVSVISALAFIGGVTMFGFRRMLRSNPK
eukprot:TRINITY_DN19663_c1_g1_i1.p1 TRINITY_DN19663_c1_g1~~TRINITY_DN19663_c1_g1_i1.p1  ORF type:complete len:386 (-),score=35.58 TRINITY_DN19663_c1_g1_i1:14-1084(-)